MIDDDDWMDDEYEVDDSDESTVDCPFCGEEIFDDCEQCPYCRMYISASDLAQPRGPLHVAIVIVLVILFSGALILTIL